MKKFEYSDLSPKKLKQLCQRPKMDFKSVFSTVGPIINKVADEGDAGINHFTKKFDGAAPHPIAVNPDNLNISLEDDTQQAINTAFSNIRSFHEAQLPDELKMETMPGVECKRISRPIERVGLYVPGGTAMLPSTLMMLGIPAMLAECETIVIATPPQANGEVADEIIYIAQKIGADLILKAGGAQAIAGMAWGTESVPKVHKILGPGNQYVTAAKMMLQNSEAQIAIDMPAGPSEVLVIADEAADPKYVAADLISQAEHGTDSQAVLVHTAGFNVDDCLSEVEHQLAELPRKDVAHKAISQSFSLQVRDLKQAFDFSNRYAPEHLILQCKNPEQWEEHIINAGSVFLGPWTPESAGDYASGTNHTLPTYGYARMFSGISVDSFLKRITVQQITKDGLQQLGPTIQKLAEIEELHGHKKAVSIRLKDLDNRNS